jgi:hypothetical protein
VLEKLRFASPSLHIRGFAYAPLFKHLVPVLSAFTTLVGKEKKIVICILWPGKALFFYQLEDSVNAISCRNCHRALVTQPLPFLRVAASVRVMYSKNHNA